MKYLLGLFSSLLFFSCAQVVAPTGGEKDITPPAILNAKPKNQSLNFNSNTITFSFDEFIKLNKFKEQLIVSPPLKYDLETTIVGKSLKIKIEDTLQENTTYVLNFGDAIVDITENNPISNFQYVFSTGNIIDSLSIKGTAINAYDLKASKEMLIMLYSDIKNDSVPLNSLPNYVGRSIETGEFELTNIKEGEYKLFALKDANKNFLFDRADEEIAFIDSTIIVNKNLDSLKLYTFLEDNQKQYIENQVEKDAYSILDFKTPTKAFNYKILDTAEILHYYMNSNQDSAFFWWKEMPNSKVKLAINDDTLFSDTIKITIDSISQKSKLKLEKPLSNRQNYYSPISLNFNRPIAKLDDKKIVVLNSDSSEINFKIIQLNDGSRKSYSLSFGFEEDSSYSLNILPGAFEDVYQRTTDTLNYKFQFNKPSDFGTLEIKINTSYEGQKIVQLIKGKDKLIEEKVITKDINLEEEKVKFEHLKDGSYKLKLIIERIPNGKWDTGNYLKGEQAEKIIFFNEEIRIRANWDKEIEWIIK